LNEKPGKHKKWQQQQKQDNSTQITTTHKNKKQSKQREVSWLSFGTKEVLRLTLQIFKICTHTHTRRYTDTNMQKGTNTAARRGVGGYPHSIRDDDKQH